MADTIDRRSEDKSCDSPGRKRRKKYETEGLCTYCGKTAVQNRKTCYECSDRQQWYNLKSMVKRHPSEVLTILEELGYL